MNCEDCRWNNDGLCEKFGYFVNDEDSACKIIEPNKEGKS